MSKYTTQVRYIVDMLSRDNENFDSLSPNERIKLAADKLFDFDYDKIDELDEKFRYTFLLRNYTEEICEETFALWKLRLEEQMLLIMPKYVMMWDAISVYNPFESINITDETTGNETEENKQVQENNQKVVGEVDTTGKTEAENSQNGNASTTSDTTENGVNIMSDFPQTTLNNLDYANGSEQRELSSNVETTGQTIDTTNIDETRTSNTGSVYDTTGSVDVDSERTLDSKTTKTTKGFNGNMADTFAKHRENVISIINLIILDLDILFLKLW